MANYSQHVSKKNTAQTEKAKDGQKKNNAGGFTFVLDKWAVLDRFLILGAEGNTYYCSEKTMVKRSTFNIELCLKEDGLRVVNRVVEISESGRAPKNDPAIFVLAIAASHEDIETRKAALAALSKVCRIGTHLFHFVRDVKNFRNWGNGLRTAVAAWYTEKTPEKLAYQIVKYQQRDGWSNKDLLRLSHPVAPTEEHATVFRYIMRGMDFGDRVISGVSKTKNFGERKYPSLDASKLPRIIEGFEKAKTEKDPKVIAKLVTEYGLTREMVPTEALNSVEVWQALLQKMPMNAMVRNLGKMTAIGLLKPLSSETKKVVDALSDQNQIMRARLHPIALLSALKVYSQGHGEKGKLAWTPVPAITAALDKAFYLSFKTIEPTGKNILLALDVSGSMGQGQIAGVPGITPRECTAAMSMVTARTEQNWHVVGFTGGGDPYGGIFGRRGTSSSEALTDLGISPNMSLTEVIKKISGLPFGTTDCALPMIHAQKHKLEVDAFFVYTDNETYAGSPHPFQALKNYRQSSGRNAKLVVVGTTATGFTIADPSDPGMLDVVGFDTAAPAIMADFIRDREISAPQVEEDSE